MTDVISINVQTGVKEVRPFTQNEIAKRQAMIRANEKTPLELWEIRMAATDRDMPRAVEDILDALPSDIKAGIAQETIDLYNEKKLIRLERPNA